MQLVSNECWFNRIDPNVVHLLAIYGNGIWNIIIWRDFKHADLIYPPEILMHSVNLGAQDIVLVNPYPKQFCTYSWLEITTSLSGKESGVDFQYVDPQDKFQSDQISLALLFSVSIPLPLMDTPSSECFPIGTVSLNQLSARLGSNP